MAPKRKCNCGRRGCIFLGIAAAIAVWLAAPRGAGLDRLETVPLER